MARPLTKEEQEKLDAEAREWLKMQASPLYFISFTWNLVPQPLLPEYQAQFELGLLLKGKSWDKFCAQVSPKWFGGYEDGKHITWQQVLALHGIEKALRGEVPSRISIVSGHGIGKSTLLSWLILWFLFVRVLSQVATTSPSKEQMYDVLWKELKKWIDRMPEGMAAQYIWETSHVRMNEAPETWFARAKTASKENTEALAGVHADWVFMAVDEASGVEEPIFETMEGALTSGNILVFLISNGTRNIGYFYDTHHKDKERWQCFAFNAEESPRVDSSSVNGWKDKYGEDSVQYHIRVLGHFPDEGVMDDKGYVQLFNEKELHWKPYDSTWIPVGRRIAALDPSGEGQDTSDFALRDRMRAAIMHTEKESTPAGLAQKGITLLDKYEVDPIDFVIDAFGKGHMIAQEIALMTSQQKRPWRVTPVNTGDQCEDEAEREFYLNQRAEAYYKFMLWCRAGGELMELADPMLTKQFKEELLSIRFRRTQNGRIQIMDKVSMKKLGFRSPNKADAVSMTFLRRDGQKRSMWGTEQGRTSPQFDQSSTVGDL